MAPRNTIGLAAPRHFRILVVNLLMGEHGSNLRLCGHGRLRWQISLSMVLVPTDAANIIPGIGLMAEVALVDACMLLVRDHH